MCVRGNVRDCVRVRVRQCKLACLRTFVHVCEFVSFRTDVCVRACVCALVIM